MSLISFIYIISIFSAEPDVLWSAVTSGGVYCSIDMGDLDGDGISDVACGVNSWDDEPTLWAVSGADGSTIWTSSAHNGIYSNEGFKWFPDTNGDGKREILMATPGGYAPPGRCLYLISGADGSTIWEWAACEIMPSYTGWGYSCAALPDINGDNVPECVGGFGTSGSPSSGLLACIDGASGDSLWTVWLPDAGEDVEVFADVNSDGVEDILLAVGGNGYADETARLVDGATGTVLWQNNPGGDCMSIALADQTDTWPLAVFCTFNGNVACYDCGGSLQWNYTGSGMYMDIQGGPDIDGDGVGDIALAADNSGVMCLSGSDGNVIWSYPSGSNTWSAAWVNPVMIQGEPVPCVAAGSVNGRSVCLLNADTGELIWEKPFTERVYNVSIVTLDYLSPVVIAGLQDQQSLPDHAWALASSTETGIVSVSQPGLINLVSPSTGAVSFSIPGEGALTVQCFDLSGRIVFQGQYSGNQSVTGIPMNPGIYIIRVRRNTDTEVLKVTIL
ncbi:MAG: PQQ-binding-like beta-propeller repeat protein [Candidatus Sabulitectum sp.]|nr:PQQ-binding-like beta-propeller repeat protein [Candidatus Sabulitectum sp.]